MRQVHPSRPPAEPLNGGFIREKLFSLCHAASSLAVLSTSEPAMGTKFSPPRFVWDVNDYRGVSWTVALVCLVLSISSLLARLLYRQYSRALKLDDAAAGGLLVRLDQVLSIAA